MNKEELEQITKESEHIISVIIQSIMDTFEHLMPHPEDVYDLEQIKQVLESIKGVAGNVTTSMMMLAFLDEDDENI